MITEIDNSWKRDSDGLGVWEHRGKVAIAGFGHSPVDRRWDEVSLDTTLGAYAILACQKAMDDAGLKPEDIDGIVCCPTTIAGNSGGTASNWAPRPYFDPPFDSEQGITRVNADWLIQQLGLHNVKFAPASAPTISEMVGLASQAVGDGLCTNCLMIYPTGNLTGRYRRGGPNASDMAPGESQWTFPWGNHGGNDFINIFPHQEYCRKYGGEHDDVAPFVLNQHRNGLMTPWGFNYQNDIPQLTKDDYLTSRYILRPLRLWDCDRPVNAAGAYLFTTSERAQDMKQKPVYVLNHSEHNFPFKTTQPTLDEIEMWTDKTAERMYEGSGLTASEVDIFNPYDGYSIMSQFFLEAFQWHGVNRGDAFAFYDGDITVEGPHPFCSSGGNLGNGRTRTAMYTDSIEQLRGTAGARQVTVKAETALCAFTTPSSGGWLMLGNSPD
jgi:acetyl-CoA acetyltransferase